MLMVPLSPLVLVGLFMTVLILPAIFGVPLLLLTSVPWRIGLRVGLGRTAAGDVSLLGRGWIVVCIATSAIALVSSAVVGFDDFDTAEDALWWALAIAMALSATTGAVGILRASARPGSIRPAPAASD